MPLVAHPTELRNRVGTSLLFVLLGTALAFWWYEQGLGDFIRAPYCGLPDHLRYLGEDFDHLRDVDLRRYHPPDIRARSPAR